MNLFAELDPKCPPNPRLGDLKAIIAFSHETLGLSTAILWCSPELRDDLKESGCDPHDCFLADKGPGIYVWEGHIHQTHDPHSGEYDVEYQGTLRDLTDTEWACLRAGRNPLAEGIPDGTPGVRDANAPCRYFKVSGSQPGCHGDGHHLCQECPHLSREGSEPAPQA